MSDLSDGPPVAAHYVRALNIGVVVILAVWHFGYDVLILYRGWPEYDPQAAAFGSWLVIAGVQIVASVLVLRDMLGPGIARTLAAIALGAAIVAVVTYPPGQAISNMSWAWNTVGWFGVLLLMQQPIWELIVLLTVNAGITVAGLAADGSLDRITTARFIVVVYATAGIQLLFALVGHQLRLAAERATSLAVERSERLARRAAEEAVHAGRQIRYSKLQERIEPLLQDLAERRADPTDPVVQRTAGIEAARLRRLFAETDDTDDPLLHELRACADVAERREVSVTFVSYGTLPALPCAVRRALSEAPLLVLASAASWARLTIMADGSAVSVSVVADAPEGTLNDLTDMASVAIVHDREEDQLWVETRWQSPTFP